MIGNAGAVFINRSSRKDIDPINTAIAQTLQQGGNICFFPEARTSLGNGVLPLKAALFESALLARAPVQAIALRYYDAHGRRSEAVSFADASLPVSLWRILRMPRIVVRADFAEAIAFAADRFAVKTQVEDFLRRQVLSDSPAPERVLPGQGER
nr:1-acyl-sn-glycerol-3-phosphate acyltransferase [Conchiformibius kuhniae]